MAAPRSATIDTPTTEPVLKRLRCIVKSKELPDGRIVPIAPFWNKAFGGKAFCVETAYSRKTGDGEDQMVPVRGIVQDFYVGGPECELERVKAAIRRKIVRWQNETRGRGLVLSKRVCSQQYENGAATGKWVESPAPMFRPMQGDLPLSQFVSIEEVVPGSERGPEIPLE